MGFVVERRIFIEKNRSFETVQFSSFCGINFIQLDNTNTGLTLV